MATISPTHRERCRALIEAHAAYGGAGKAWARYVGELAKAEGYRAILDYGAGRGTLAGALPDLPIACYEPAVPGFDDQPAPADLVICTDVLQYVEPSYLTATLQHLAALTRRKLFVAIDTAPRAEREPREIVRPASWWRTKIAKHFRIGIWHENEGCGLAFCEALPVGREVREPRKRRSLPPDWQKMLGQIRDHNHRYTDEFSRIHSFNCWEGVGDEPADMQIALCILERIRDIDAEIRHMLKFAKKAIMAMIELTSPADEIVWRRIFERHLRIGDFHVDQVGGVPRLIITGAPKVNVAGINAVGAMHTDERWEQVKAACGRIKARFQPAPAHNRRAIVACYGPSLGRTAEDLEAERKATGAAVISVSGAHDFLLSRGIIPDYHVECDPRPHKADNIESPHDGIVYLIGSAVHPCLLDKLEGADVRLWHVSTPEHMCRLIDELGESSNTTISGGGSVGLRSVPLLYNMGYRDFSIYGMDCSFADGGKQQWAGKHAGKRQDIVEVECGGRLFHSSPVLMTYAAGFFEMVAKIPDASIRLYGDGLLQNILRAYAELPQFAYVKTGQGIAV